MSDMKKVTLVLSDGTKFHGKSFGYDAPVAGEVVFNTAMMGYPESLTDPSYAGQLMTLTFPLVGNYGVPPFTFEENGLPTFMESDKIYASAIIVNDYSEQYSHWNAVESLADWLKREKVPGITGIDTRELTKVLREHGVMMGKILFDDEPETFRTSGRPSLSEGNFKSVRALNAAKRYMETHSSHPASRGTGSSAASVSSSAASSAGSSSCGLQEGMKIEHQRFGRGTVLKIEGTGENTKATVEFVHSGTKQLLLKYAKFTVVD